MEFKVGDKVTWKTKLGNIILKKIGEIILILESGENFYIAIEDLKKRCRFNVIYSGVSVKDHKSCIVIMKEKGRLSKLYWPSVKDLKKIYKRKNKKVKINPSKDW